MEKVCGIRYNVSEDRISCEIWSTCLNSETYDILDQCGKPTGRTGKKGNYESGYYLGVHCYIMNDRQEFLLQKRAPSKTFLPSSWDIHMGHVMAGETSLDGMCRELREELGITISKSMFEFYHRLLWAEYKHFIDIYFLNMDFKLPDISFSLIEVSDVKYISAENMIDLIDSMTYRPASYRTLVRELVITKTIKD